MKVTCVPRETVSACGHTALLTMRMVRVSGSVEQVRVDDGPVAELLPPHAMRSATLAAAAPANTLVDVTRRS
jgi:hypothetical protein